MKTKLKMKWYGKKIDNKIENKIKSKIENKIENEIENNKPKVWSVQLKKTLNFSITFSVPPSTRERVKYFWVQKNFGSKKILGLKHFFGSK